MLTTTTAALPAVAAVDTRQAQALSPSIGQRASALALAMAVTFGLLGSMGEIADVQQQAAKAEWLAAQAETPDATDAAPVQTVVITGHRLAKV